ncbi:TlpA family protein disulfide reductase [Ferrimonas lipolytica]|uniref:TlpA family protein disulfide reductase n=1 Tax=Ferrimonas lipolytica TaxID=2724191 RepID=A0A6H1UA13_9GAMM|nr:TlpA disulfide reductase family protein [Ferrimonas lipolytica]QIZ75469.1 TlpA family protein disulfide reductase [Ferrimonas lipolytica]
MRHLIVTALLACALIPTAFASALPKAYSNGPKIEDKPMHMSRFVEYTNARIPPLVDFTDMQGNKVNLSQHKGSLVMVNIWATWCPPCVKELPELRELQARYQDKGLIVQPISIDEEPSDVAPMLEKYDLTDIPTWIDPEINMEKIITTETVPATFFFDGNGNMVGFIRGYLEWLDPAVAPYLEALIEKYAEPKQH